MGNCWHCYNNWYCYENVATDTIDFTIKDINCTISVKKENIANSKTSAIVLPMIAGIDFAENTYKIPDLRKGAMLADIKEKMAKTTDNSNQYIIYLS